MDRNTLLESLGILSEYIYEPIMTRLVCPLFKGITLEDIHTVSVVLSEELISADADTLNMGGDNNNKRKAGSSPVGGKRKSAKAFKKLDGQQSLMSFFGGGGRK